jgi:hypothetical protein
MRSRDFRNSPLKKGDKGGCEDDMEKEIKKQPPPPPLLRGNISPNSGHISCSAGLTGYSQMDGEPACPVGREKGEGHVFIRMNSLGRGEK